MNAGDHPRQAGIARRAVVTIAVAVSLSEATSVSLATHLSAEPARLVPPVVVADASARSSEPVTLSQLVVDLLTPQVRGMQLVVATPPPVSLVDRARRRGSDRVPVAVGSLAERISTVSLPRRIVDAETVIAVNDVRQDAAERPTLAIGLWARFAGLRERLGVRLAKPDEGLAAEIALAVRPTLVLLAESWRGYPVVISTADQIAAELVGLALRQAKRDGDDDLIGPWQDPLVQRATELDLGVRLPEQIAIRLTCVGVETSRTADEAATLLENVATRLGVRDAALRACGA